MAFMLFSGLTYRFLLSAMLLSIATRPAEAQSIRQNPDFTPEMKALLQTSPALLVASLYPQLGRLPVDPKTQLRIDEKRHSVLFKRPNGIQTELLCDRLDDGLRRTYPGTNRHEIRLQCIYLEHGPKASPPLKWTVIVEREGDRVVAELSGGDAYQHVIAGTMLPSHLPNWVPDLSSVDSKLLEIVGQRVGFRGAYEIRITLTSRLEPGAFIRALSIKGEVRQSEGEITIRREFENASYGVATVDWRSSNGEYIYRLHFSVPGLALEDNRSAIAPQKR